jgi:hypothetical protein
MTKKKSFLMLLILSILAIGLLSGCGTGGAGDTTPTATPISTAASAASINLSASPATVKSDGTTSTVVTVTALDASNASMSGVVVAMSTDAGVLGASSVTTNATTPATVSFSSPGNPINRTATITATSGSVSKQIPVQIVGSTVTLNASASSLPNDGISTITLTVTARDAGSNVVKEAAVAITKSGSGDVTITPETGTTDKNTGVFTATIKGVTAGSVTLTAAALGATSTPTNITVTPVGANFAIDQQTLNGIVIANNATTAMKIGDALALQVNAPTSTTVTFATTIGVWDGGTRQDVTKPVVAGKATATLGTTQSGVASVQVYADANNKDTRTVAMSSGAAPYRIIIQASPTNVPVSVGTTTGSSTLIATVYDNTFPTPNPISGVPVLFSIINPTSGGETVLPVVVSTAATTTGGLSLGQASAAFTSGSMASSADGIKVRASVVGTTVATNTAPSGNDAKIIIGGVAGSIAFGQATVIQELNAATYSWPMSILVADSAGAAVANAEVSLSVWPIAWSTGEALGCAYDSDDSTLNRGTFWNEDRNENMFLDATPAPAEDGARWYYADKTRATFYLGTQDGYITPTNSASGTVPSKVTTDANGVATFNLNYPKQSAIWTVVRMRATTKVLGSETRGELILRLAAISNDIDPCRLGWSPYKY